MNTAQITALKAIAAADATAAGYMAAADDIALAAWFNAQTAFVVWRTAMSTQLSRSAIILGATQLDALTVGKRDSLLWLCSETLNPSDANVRAAIDDLCGTQTTLKAALQSAQKRTATRAEQALATGTGTTASPGTLTYEGMLSYGDASLVRSL